MHWHRFLSIVSLISYCCAEHTLALPEGYGAQLLENLSAKNPCVSPFFRTNFCDRCARQGITDAITCAMAELRPIRSDGGVAKSTLISTASIGFRWEKFDITLGINIDSCRRVGLNSIVGPLTVGETFIFKADMQTIVDQLLPLAPRKSIELVLANGERGKEEANKKFSLGQELGDVLTLGAGPNNATIKVTDAVLCKGALAISTCIGVQALAQKATTGHVSLDPDTVIAAMTVWAMVILDATYKWLTAVPKKEPIREIWNSVSLIVLPVVCRLGQLVHDLPQVPWLNRARIAEHSESWLTSINGTRLPQEGVTDNGIATGTAPEACEMV